MAAEVRFTKMADGREIAYRVMSATAGPTILFTAAATFPCETLDEDPMVDRFLRTLAQCGRLVLFDKPGTGESDPLDRDRDYIDQTVDAYLAVLDAVEAPAGWIVGVAALEVAQLAVDHPERLLGAALLDPTGPDGPRPSDAQAFVTDRDYLAAEDNPSRAGDAAYLTWIQRAKRLGASGSDARDYWEAMHAAVARGWAEVEPVVDAPPVLLLHRRDGKDIAHHRWWNRIFPQAECVTVDGADHSLIVGLDAGYIAELVAAFISGSPIDAPVERQLVAVLFTDLVDSTRTAAATGDAIWRTTLDQYETGLKRTIERHHGSIVKHTGDGALTTFASGSEAIAAAVELRDMTHELGLDGRTGIHVGEVERRGDDISGIAVNLAARVMGQADPGEIVVSQGAVSTTLGGRFRFEDLGPRTLKGIEQPVNLFVVDLQQ